MASHMKTLVVMDAGQTEPPYMILKPYTKTGEMRKGGRGNEETKLN
jgi:hypothetical protein